MPFTDLHSPSLTIPPLIDLSSPCLYASLLKEQMLQLQFQHDSILAPQAPSDLLHNNYLQHAMSMPTELSSSYGDNDQFNDTTSYGNEHDYLTTWHGESSMMGGSGTTVSPRELHQEFTPVFEPSSALAAIPSSSNYLKDEYAFGAELFRDNTPLTRDNSPYVLLPPQSSNSLHPLKQFADSVPGLVFDASTGLLDGNFDVLAAAALMSSPDMSVPEIFEWMEEYSKRKLSAFGLRITNGLLDGAHNVLVFAVLLLAPSQQMKLKDIYAAIKKNTTKRQAKNSSGWQNGVRHNLSMNEAFVKGRRIALEDDDDKRDHWWHITDDALESGVQPTTRYRNGTNTHAGQKADDSDDDENNDSGIEEVDDDEADYQPTRSKRSEKRTQQVTNSGSKKQYTSRHRRFSKRQKAGSKGGKASSRHNRQKLQFDARRAQSVASDNFARSGSPSPNIGNDSGYGSFNDASSLRARSGTPMSFEPSPAPYFSVEESSGGIMLPTSFQRAMTAEPLHHSSYNADCMVRARSATPAAHNVALMLLNRRQPKQIPPNARAMTAPPAQCSMDQLTLNHLASGFAAVPGTHTQDTTALEASGNNFHYDFCNVDPGLLTDSRDSSPFTSFDDAMMYQSPAQMSMTTTSMTSGSPYLNCGYNNDADVQYMSPEEQAIATPSFEDYFNSDSNDIMMADSVYGMDDLATKEEEATNMFMNFE